MPSCLDTPFFPQTRPDRVRRYTDWLHGKARGEPYGCLVIQNGEIVIESYEEGATPERKWEIGSIRKSVTSTLLSMALSEQRITLEDCVYPHWPDIYNLTQNEKDRDILMKHLATNTSGWMTDQMPGRTWLYNNAACTAGGSVLGRIYDLTSDQIAPLVHQRIANPIGATNWHCYHYAEPFTAGDFGKPGPKLAIDSTLRDLARFGYLWLNNGKWDQTQLICGAYVGAARTNQSRHANGHYGYWWFTNDDKVLLPGAPDDTFFHVGNGRNNRRTVLLMIPSLDLVAIVGTSALAYDINRNYRARPVPEVNEWITNVLTAIGN
jgi:CubicO group peptidase (beta-lactamase class C family)